MWIRGRIGCRRINKEFKITFPVINYMTNDGVSTKVEIFVINPEEIPVGYGLYKKRDGSSEGQEFNIAYGVTFEGKEICSGFVL